MSAKIKAKNKIYYTCSYVPLEIIWAAGFIPQRLIGQTDICAAADTHLSRNVCPYAHSVLRLWRTIQSKRTKDFKDNKIQIIVANSCDAMRKLYDIIKLESANVYLLDVPRENSKQAEDFFSYHLKSLYFSLAGKSTKNFIPKIYSSIRVYKNLRLLLAELEALVGKKIEYSDFFEIKQKMLQIPPQTAIEKVASLLAKISKQEPNRNLQTETFLLPVIVSGSPVASKEIFSAIEKAGFSILINDSCLDLRWNVSAAESFEEGIDPFSSLSRLYLKKVPCARMVWRQPQIERFSQYIKSREAEGIIHLRMPFCDLYGFDLVHLLPLIEKGRILHLDTDGSVSSLAQIKTRLQAFTEILLQKKKSQAKTQPTQLKNGNYYCGLDIGSSTVDGVILSSSGKIIASGIEKTGSNPGNTALKLYKKMIKTAHLSERDLITITTTGYGRNSFPLPHESISEISCHAFGLRHLFPQAKLVIDIGGQDSKVIKIDDNGKVIDFHMNDKCAAGTGRFLEVMAQALEMDIKKMSEIEVKKGNNVPISSVCTVFAESEVVSLLGQGYPAPNIIRGLYQAITNRIEGMVRRVGIAQPIAVTGGGALNKALVAGIEERLALPAYVPPQPQLVGAIGAAILALEKYKQK